MQKQAKQRMEKSSGMTDKEGNDRNEVNRVKVNGEEGETKYEHADVLHAEGDFRNKRKRE